MKRITLAVFALFFSVTGAHAQEPLEPAHHRFFARMVLGIGHEVKQTFADVKHDPFWGFAVVSVLTVNYMDMATSCVGMAQGGWHERNPLLGHHPSCGKLAAVTTFGSIGELTSVHRLRDGFHGKCLRDAANQDSLYNRIAEKRGVSADPRRCQIAADLALPAVDLPIHSMIIKNNLDFITWKPTRKAE